MTPALQAAELRPCWGSSMLPIIATALADIVVSTVKSFLPETSADKLRAIELAIQQQTLENDILKGQLEINKAEAENPNVFVSGWRPAVGWICAASFAWQFVVMPMLVFLSSAFGHVIPVPVFDTASMISVLGGMLGLGMLRSYDKKQGGK